MGVNEVGVVAWMKSCYVEGRTADPSAALGMTKVRVVAWVRCCYMGGRLYKALLA